MWHGVKTHEATMSSLSCYSRSYWMVLVSGVALVVAGTVFGCKNTTGGSKARDVAEATGAGPSEFARETAQAEATRVQPDWYDLSPANWAAIEQAKALHDATLTQEQLDAWQLQTSLRAQNPLAISIQQRCVLDFAFRNRFVALRRGTVDNPRREASTITHQQILDTVLIWPMTTDNHPWPIQWHDAPSDRPVPRVELAQAEISLFGTQSWDWEYGILSSIQPEVLQIYGPSAPADDFNGPEGFDQALALVQMLFGVVNLYAEQLGMPEKPQEALSYLRFSINHRAEHALLQAYPTVRFLVRADRSGYGLLLKESSGRQHLILKEAGVSGFTRLGAWDMDQEAIDAKLKDYEHWQSLQEMKLPRVELLIPEQPGAPGQ